jgi:ABC-type dipeptide/oligopeptide/nickel transport system permease component
MNFADITLEVVIIGFIVILLIGMLLSGIFFADRKNRFLSLLLIILSLCYYR